MILSILMSHRNRRIRHLEVKWLLTNHIEAAGVSEETHVLGSDFHVLVLEDALGTVEEAKQS